ncbi:MAG: hypothetical protein LBS49_03255, partial [Candidatus Accumulibacter sp.]|nr:hypothetical protein [Accumulibacter sp.]
MEGVARNNRGRPRLNFGINGGLSPAIFGINRGLSPIIHTHPTNAMPSAADIKALQSLGQSKQYVYHGGEVTTVRPN